RHLRLTIFTAYRVLLSFVLLVNLAGLVRLFTRESFEHLKPEALATWASSNFLLSILARQDFFINLIFRTAWLVPWWFPLRLRRLISRVYTYGGIHTGAAIAGTFWFTFFTVLLTIRFVQLNIYIVLTLAVSWSICSLLEVIIVLALPQFRSHHHNTFEVTHRFLGWACILLFWTQLVLLTLHTAHTSAIPFAIHLIRQPTFWNLTLITAMILLPWLRLRKWTFTPTLLSPHALHLDFPNPVHRFSCLSISSSPLREWHAFATFPSTDPNKPGSSLIVSAAGDWTTSLIVSASTPSNPNPKLTFYTKGSPKAGVLSLSCLYPRVVLLTTGSGIGPALSSLLDRPPAQICRLVWSTRSPLTTFGAGLIAQVESVDPDAVVIDTDELGRPDLVQVAWKCYCEIGAEAVFVLSNERVTRRVVYGLESRGVPAFGPIWDS
ncbi:hypothetical protein K491DRAFT_577455, partial [Lophiostoma macrostomum CBS 122681]